MEAWIAFGHAFAAQEESDQALVAYRNAERLFKGSYIPKLCIGSEYLRLNNLKASMLALNQALDAYPNDPLILNELGCVWYQQGEYVQALESFQRAIEIAAPEASVYWETLYFNAGNAFRKLR